MKKQSIADWYRAVRLQPSLYLCAGPSIPTYFSMCSLLVQVYLHPPVSCHCCTQRVPQVKFSLMPHSHMTLLPWTAVMLAGRYLRNWSSSIWRILCLCWDHSHDVHHGRTHWSFWRQRKTIQIQEFWHTSKAITVKMKWSINRCHMWYRTGEHSMIHRKFRFQALWDRLRYNYWV